MESNDDEALHHGLRTAQANGFWLIRSVPGLVVWNGTGDWRVLTVRDEALQLDETRRVWGRQACARRARRLRDGHRRLQESFQTRKEALRAVAQALEAET